MKTFKFIFLLFAILETGWVSGKNYAVKDYANQGRYVQFDIKCKKYENLLMKVVDTTPKAYYIAGKSSDNYRWTFNIPDSLSQNIWELQFFFISSNDKLGISFAAVLDNDTLTSPGNNFENNSDTLFDAGIEYAIVQIKDLLKHDVDGIHIFTMNNPIVARKICEGIRPLL